MAASRAYHIIAVWIFLLSMLHAAATQATTVVPESNQKLQEVLARDYDRAALCIVPKKIKERGGAGTLVIEGEVSQVIQSRTSIPKTITVKVSMLDRQAVVKELSGTTEPKCYDLVRRKNGSHFEFLGGKSFSELKKNKNVYINARKVQYTVEQK